MIFKAMDNIIPKEYIIQDTIRRELEKRIEVYPFDILYVDQKDNSQALLKLSFWVEEDIDEIKKLINYSSLCDKTGFLEIRETTTIIIRGYALLNFLRSIGLS